jgi:RHS repeat-associated protein
MLASERPAAGRRHFHLDQLGTPRLITTDTGAIAAQYEYYAFGPQPDAATVETPTEELKFTGHQRDLAPGDVHVLDYMHARYYDGAVGRFLAVDPELHADRAVRLPQKWNRYAYALNNPILNIDPDGRDEEIAANSNVEAIKTYLTELVRRPGGLAQFMAVVNDHNFKHRMTTGPLTAPAEIALAVQQRGKIDATFGETVPTGKVQQSSTGAPGQYVVTGAITTFDPNAISRLHPDPSGTTTAAHEYDHVNALQTGGVAAAHAGDVPTSATGPSERKGRAVAAERSVMTPQDARKLIDQYVRVVQ